MLLFTPSDFAPWVTHAASAILGLVTGVTLTGRRTLETRWRRYQTRRRLHRIVRADRRREREFRGER